MDMLHLDGNFLRHHRPGLKKRIENMKTKLVHVDLKKCIEIGLKGVQVSDVHYSFTGSYTTVTTLLKGPQHGSSRSGFFMHI